VCGLYELYNRLDLNKALVLFALIYVDSCVSIFLVWLFCFCAVPVCNYISF